MSQEVEKNKNLHPGLGKLAKETIPCGIPRKRWVVNFLFGVAILSFLACAVLHHAGDDFGNSEFILFAGIGAAFLLTFCAELLRQL